MITSFGHLFPKKVVVRLDATEQGMLKKLGRITGFSEEELIRKAVRKYYFGFTDGFNCFGVCDESEVKRDE